MGVRKIRSGRIAKGAAGTGGSAPAAVIAALLAVSLPAGLLTGCSKKTVDYDLDTQQDENGTAGGLERFADAEDWKETVEFTGADGQGRTMEINAAVQVPDADSMSVVEVEETVIDTAFKERLLEDWFGGADIYYHDIPHWTREELERLIQEEEGWIDSLEGTLDELESAPSTDDTIENYQQNLDGHREQLQQYMVLYENAGDGYIPAEDLDSCNEFIGYRDGTAYTASFSEEGEDVCVRILPGDGYSTSYIPEGMEGYDHYSYGLNTPEEGANRCAISREDARMVAEQWLESSGRSSQQLADVSDLVWYGWNDSQELLYEEDSLTVRDGWCFIYSTGVDGIPFSSYGSAIIYNVPDTAGISGFGYSLYESTSVYVNGDGVIGMEMTWPVTVTKITEQVELLPLSAIQSIMKDDVEKNPDRYDWGERSVKRFNSLELVYFRVKGGKAGVYSYVPAWRLGNQSESGMEYFAVVNAIDGSVIYPGQELSGWEQDTVSP